MGAKTMTGRPPAGRAKPGTSVGSVICQLVVIAVLVWAVADALGLVR